MADAVDGGAAGPHGAAHELWRALSEFITDVVIQTKPDGTIVFVHRVPRGVDAASLLGRSVFDFVTASQRADVRRCFALLTSGDSARQRLVQVELPDGTRAWYATTSVPVMRDGHVVAVTIAARDIALERSLGDAAADSRPVSDIADHWRRVQRLEMVGLLAGGLVHDFRNVLAGIAASVESMLATMAHDHELRPDIEVVQQAVRHGTSVARRLLDLARGQRGQAERVDLNTVVSDVVTMARLFFNGHVRLETHLDPTGAPIVADRTAMEQVLFNLLLNARDALPLVGGHASGSIIVSTRRLVYTATTAPPNCKLRGTVVRMRVDDTGTGMDDATRARIFEPFFTTKSGERGTGLGLPTVDAIVKESGGCVELVSRVGTGTTVDVVIPDADRVGLCAA